MGLSVYIEVQTGLFTSQQLWKNPSVPMSGALHATFRRCVEIKGVYVDDDWKKLTTTSSPDDGTSVAPGCASLCTFQWWRQCRAYLGSGNWAGKRLVAKNSTTVLYILAQWWNQTYVHGLNAKLESPAVWNAALFLSPNCKLLCSWGWKKVCISLATLWHDQQGVA